MSRNSKSDYVWAGISISYLAILAISFVDFIGKVPTCHSKVYGFWDIATTIMMMFSVGMSFVNIYKITGGKE